MTPKPPPMSRTERRKLLHKPTDSLHTVVANEVATMRTRINCAAKLVHPGFAQFRDRNHAIFRLADEESRLVVVDTWAGEPNVSTLGTHYFGPDAQPWIAIVAVRKLIGMTFCVRVTAGVPPCVIDDEIAVEACGSLSRVGQLDDMLRSTARRDWKTWKS